MKNRFIKLSVIALFALGCTVFTSCSSSNEKEAEESHKHEEGEKDHEHKEDDHDHDHEEGEHSDH